MIVPDKPIIKIIICSAVAIFGPMLAMRQRKSLPVDTSLGVKWRRIKLLEAMLEILVGTTGAFVFSLALANIPMPESIEIWLGIIAIILGGCIAAIEDAYNKAWKTEEKAKGSGRAA